MRKKSVTKTDKQIIVWVCTVFSVVMVLWLLVHTNNLMSFENLGVSDYINENNISNYLSILSIHFTTVFLTTGLMSTLGAKEDLIYHVDIVQLTLLKPVGRSFKALSVYSFLTLFWAAVAFVFRASYMVIFTTVIGVIIVSWLFFKMIRIYFEREKEKEKIKKSLKEKKSIEELHRALVQLHLIMRSNIEEKKISSLVDNMALLIELRQYFLCVEAPIDRQQEMNMEMYGEKISERKSKYALEFLLATEADIKGTEDISIFEIYVKIYEKFREEQERVNNKRISCCKKKSQKQELEKTVAEKSMAYAAETVIKYWEDKRRVVVREIYKIDDIVERLLENYEKEVEELDSNKDYKVCDYLFGASKYLELAERIFVARTVITSGKISYGMAETEYFYRDIRILVNKDEQRIKNGEVECSKEYCFEYEDNGQIYQDLNSLLRNENYEGPFIRVLPKLGLKYVFDNLNNILRNFYYTYKYKSCMTEDDNIEIYVNEPEFFRPRDEKTYETMLCLFFQGCAELIMSGKGASIIDTVVELLFDFWRTAQFYKKSDKLQEFYTDTFEYIGCRLLYISNDSNRYNEHPEDVQKFLKQLIILCRKDDRPVAKRVKNFDAEIVFVELLRKLEKYNPEYYSDDAVKAFKKIIESGKITK